MYVQDDFINFCVMIYADLNCLPDMCIYKGAYK